MGCGVGPAVCPAGGGLEAAVCMGQRPEEVDDGMRARPGRCQWRDLDLATSVSMWVVR